MSEKVSVRMRSVLSRAARHLLQASLALALFLGGWNELADGLPNYNFREDREYRCLVSAVWYESRGEAARGRRAVLDTIQHRHRLSGLSYCGVVSHPRQFHWYARKGLVRLTDEQIAAYNDAIAHPEVLIDERHRWFYSGSKPTWAKKMICRSIGGHKFCKER